MSRTVVNCGNGKVAKGEKIFLALLNSRVRMIARRHHVLIENKQRAPASTPTATLYKFTCRGEVGYKFFSSDVHCFCSFYRHTWNVIFWVLFPLFTSSSIEQMKAERTAQWGQMFVLLLSFSSGSEKAMWRNSVAWHKLLSKDLSRVKRRFHYFPFVVFSPLRRQMPKNILCDTHFNRRWNSTIL